MLHISLAGQAASAAATRSRRSLTCGARSSARGPPPPSALPLAPPATPARSASASQAAPPSTPLSSILTVLSSEPLEDGTLHTLSCGPLHLPSHPAGELRTVRVWVPTAPPLGLAYPSLLLLDGQNLFQDELAFAGRSWGSAAAASAAIASAATPPFVVVGVDHSFNLRSLDYLPVVPGTGMGNFRPEAATWPGGGVDAFLSALSQEVLPLLRARFNLSADPELSAFGGSSFGGVASLHAMLSGHPLGRQFSAFLVESPSLWIDEGRWLTDTLLPILADGAAPLPARTFLAMGGKEHTGTRSALAASTLGLALDKAHVARARQLAGAFEAACVAQGGGEGKEPQFLFRVDAKGAHSEPAWAARLPSAIEFLMGPMGAHERPPPPPPPPKRKRKPAAPAAPAAPPPPPPAPAVSQASVLDSARAAMNRNELYFFDTPPREGQPYRLFLNRRRASVPLWERPRLSVRFGYENWTAGAPESAQLLPTSVAGGADARADWWVCAMPPPPSGVKELNLVFTDDEGMWENGNGTDFACIVCAAAASDEVQPRSIVSRETHEMSGGTLHLIQLGPRVVGDGSTPPDAAAARAARWQEEKVLRVWTPPGWQAGQAPPGGYPVLYISDAQNLFEDWLSHQGVSWRAAETAAALISSGQLPPFLIVGIDAAGAFRSLNFLPFAPGAGAGGFRPDCARWPGGNVAAYLRRVATDVLPLAEREFGASASRERRAFGGASFGGVAALHAAMTCSHLFASFLVESPSLWVGEGRYLKLMRGPWPQAPPGDVRLFLGSGGREYSATRDEGNEELDVLLGSYHQQAAEILGGKGISGGRLRYVKEDEAGHHEGAWGWRLGGALVHLFHGR